MRIRATVRYMAASEIAEMVPASKIAEIKSQGDSNPVFKAFVIGQEGPATGYLFGIGNVVKRWYARAIRMLHDRVSASLKVFQGHAAETNEHEGRTVIGEVVGKKLLNLKEKLSTVVACYIFPPFRNIPFDVASIEVEIGLKKDDRGTYVSDVGEVTGIALGNSGIDTPGFAGATLLGQLQAFARKNKEEDDLTKTAEELRAEIREAGFQPSDLFSARELTADPLMAEHIREKTANPEGFYEFRKLKKDLAESEKRLVDMEKEKTTLAEKVKSQEAALSASSLESAKTKIGPLFEKAKTDRKLTERQVKFAQSRLDKFEVKKADELQKEFDSFLDAVILEEKKIATEIYGLKEEEPKKKEGTGPGKEGETSDIPDALNPDLNPMIPKVSLT